MRSLRRAVLACAAVALVASGTPAVAAPHRTVVGDLRGTTTVTWSGHAAIRLRVPKDVLVPRSAYRFTVRSGRFIAVRAFSDPQPIGCKRDYGLDWCASVMLNWLADAAETTGHGTYSPDPSRDFTAMVGDPPVVRRGMWDLYLFTDRTATIEIQAEGLPGRASYAAGGRFAGRAVLNPGPCRAPACVPGTADQRFGGDAFDVGPLGFVHAMSYGLIAPHWTAGAGREQVFLLRSCTYPGLVAPDASPDPAAHPTGCDVVPPSSAMDSALGLVNEAGSAGPAGGRMISGPATFDARGRVYQGFRATSIGPDPARLGGLLIWLRYGIT